MFKHGFVSGIQGQLNPGRPDSNRGGHRNCLEMCQKDNKCPSRQTFDEEMRTASQNCMTCLTEECGKSHID